MAEVFFHQLLTRLRHNLDHNYGLKGDQVVVQQSDLKALIRDWERLDREYRALYANKKKFE